MSITPNVLATRYATKEMVAIFDPVNKIIAERKFWITILKLQKTAGLPITDSDVKAYEQVVEKVDLTSIDKREMKTRHDVKARIEEFNALAGVEKIHICLTSRDLTENIELIQIKVALELIEQISLPVVISSALDSSVGISHGLALACAIPNLYGACGLATVALLEGDVTSNSLLASNGVIVNRRVTPDRISEFKVDNQRQKWWQDRADVIYEGSLI